MDSALSAVAQPAATALMVLSALVLHNYQLPSELARIPQLTSLIGNFVSSAKDIFQAHVDNPSLIVDSIARVVESVLRIDTRQTKEEHVYGEGKAPSQQLRHGKLERMFNPPTRTACVALVIFVLSVQYIHELRQADRHQNQFLLTGFVVGVNASVIAWILSPENLFAFKTLVPGSVISALVLSSLAHRFLIAKEVEKEKKDQ